MGNGSIHGESSSVTPDDLAMNCVSGTRGNLLEGYIVATVHAFVSDVGTVSGTDAVDYCGTDEAVASMCDAGCEVGMDTADVGVINGSVFGVDGTSCEAMTEASDGDFPPLQASAQKRRGRPPKVVKKLASSSNALVKLNELVMDVKLKKNDLISGKQAVCNVDVVVEPGLSALS
ncbi:hypothetical protein V6N12_068048 [Hibiscus sabdariffa]|uniref:Uncharacterized protein n=1 Tax=Hibiscus sabdariffa TaxID=183260 RepID=A0ABR2FPK0_9ROSI